MTEQDVVAGGLSSDPPNGLMVDTIAAVATATGLGAVAVIRLSGGRSFEILRALTPDHPDRPPMRSPRLLSLRDAKGALLDRALVTAFPGPDSYTGEEDRKSVV